MEKKSKMEVRGRKSVISGQFAAIVNPSPLLISRRGQGWLSKHYIFNLCSSNPTANT
ncbi:hypothetical protein ABIB40_001769 [Pedobacter sp. UYP30]